MTMTDQRRTCYHCDLPIALSAIVRSDDHSNHNLTIGARVEFLHHDDFNGVDLYTLGIVDDEVAIDPRDLTARVWVHVDHKAYQKWLADLPHDKGEHLARWEPACKECGRDNANGTHNALERTGHLGHAFRT